MLATRNWLWGMETEKPGRIWMNIIYIYICIIYIYHIQTDPNWIFVWHICPRHGPWLYIIYWFWADANLHMFVPVWTKTRFDRESYCIIKIYVWHSIDAPSFELKTFTHSSRMSGGWWRCRQRRQTLYQPGWWMVEQIKYVLGGYIWSIPFLLRSSSCSSFRSCRECSRQKVCD